MTAEHDIEVDLDRFRQSWADRVMQSPVMNVHAIAASDAYAITHSRGAAERCVFTVQAYRDRDKQDSPVVVQNIVVEMQPQSSEPESSIIIQPYQVMHLRVRFADIEPGRLRGYIEELAQSAVHDEALEATAQELKEPLVIRDADLGSLTLDRRFSCFEGRIRSRWRRVDITIHAATPEELHNHLPAFKSLLNNLQQIDSASRKSTCDELQETYNSNWRDPRKPMLKGDALGKKIRLSNIEFHPSERLTLYYRAGNLFWGHDIEVRCNPDGTVFEVCLAG